MPDGNQVKISQYADDTVIILRDWSTFTHVKKWIHFFCQASGMKLNKNKTEGMWLGSLADIPQLRLRTYDQHKIGWIQPNQLLRSLGTMLTIKGDSKPFWDKKLSAIHSRLLNWKRLFPSMLGKNFISKLSLFSCIWYYTQSMYVPKTFKDSLNNMINTFIWSTIKKQDIDKKTNPKMAKASIIQEASKGGCRFLHLQSEINAFATRWIQRLLDPSVRMDFVTYRKMAKEVYMAGFEPMAPGYRSTCSNHCTITLTHVDMIVTCLFV